MFAVAGFGARKDNSVNILGVFAKFWEPGAVKTRLAASIGAADAALLHRWFLVTVLHRMNHLAGRKALVFSPPERREEFSEVCPELWSLQEQGEGNLGRRMRRFLQWAFAAGARHVVVLGSDSPSVPTAYVANAFEQLQNVPVVLGPSDDGGYYLVGVSSTNPEPPIFEGISWGTSSVLQETVANLHGADIAYGRLPSWYDVDRLPDLRRLSDELTSATQRDAPLAALTPVVTEICERVS